MKLYKIESVEKKERERERKIKQSFLRDMSPEPKFQPFPILLNFYSVVLSFKNTKMSLTITYGGHG